MVHADQSNEIFRVISNVNAAITNMRLYSDEHPQVHHYLENAHFELMKFLLDKPETTLLLFQDEFVCDQKPVRYRGPHVAQFIQTLGKLAIERITFVSGVTKQELHDLLRDLTSPEQEYVHSSDHIKLGKLDIRIDPEAAGPEGGLPLTQQAETLAAMPSLCEAKLEDIKEIYSKIARHQRIDPRGLGDVVNTFVRAFSYGMSPIRMLASLKSVDEYTFTHVVNVCILTMSQAESLGFKGEHLYQIGIASALHDAGKLFVPAEILSKPGALTPEERSIIEAHTVRGARYILELEGLPKLSVLGALEHHIRYDGTGYPLISRGWKPNIVSQMIAISDVFDAMRSRRCYKEPKSVELIIKILKSEKGTAFNPVLVDNFIKLIKR
jgi:HD-GYP domain-containing protein (c-di-GMP phosphodiesterase class II)